MILGMGHLQALIGSFVLSRLSLILSVCFNDHIRHSSDCEAE